jgi:hypothetical protein
MLEAGHQMRSLLAKKSLIVISRILAMTAFASTVPAARTAM